MQKNNNSNNSNKRTNNKGSNNNSNNKKNNSAKKKSSPLLIFLLVFLIIFVILAVVIASSFLKLYENGGIDVSKRASITEKQIELTISEGSSIKTIASVLASYGIIDDENTFYLKCKNENIGAKFQAGDFILSNKMTFNELVSALEKALVNNDEQLKILIKEGDTQEDIANTLNNMGIITYDDFMNTANNTIFNYDFLQNLPQNSARTSKLEGYLYPDTYFLSDSETAESIIHKLLSRFDQLYTQDLKNKASQMGLTTDEVITIASIIEKEIKYAPERNIASSVIFNRLDIGMKLQMDATVLYAKQEHSDRTTIADTQIESPYNTYYIEGIPVGPISNPSIACIEAVLNPADTDYLYYVVEDDATGQHFYTSDYNEFLKAKQNYLKKFD